MKKLVTACLIIICLQGFSQSIKPTYTANSIFLPNVEVPGWYAPRVYSYEYSNSKSITKMISGPVPGPNIQSPTEDIYYKDFTTGTYRWEITMGNESYSVKDKINDFDWKISTETEIINGYRCTKATGMARNTQLTAWFCNDIKVHDGPNRYYGLPGLILKININNNTEIIATEIETSNKLISIKEPVVKSQVLNFKDMIQLMNEGVK